MCKQILHVSKHAYEKAQMMKSLWFMHIKVSLYVLYSLNSEY